MVHAPGREGGSHHPCTVAGAARGAGEAAAHPDTAAFHPHLFRRGEKIAAISTVSLHFQVRNPGRSQVCWRKVGERLPNLAALGRLFMAGFGATFDTFRYLIPTSHGPVLQLGWRRGGRGKCCWQLP